MSLLYNFDIDTPEDILQLLACNLQKRRLEKGLSRDALSKLSGVPSPTIAKFEQKFSISLSSYVALTFQRRKGTSCRTTLQYNGRIGRYQ